jgi:hypothetical protein
MLVELHNLSGDKYPFMGVNSEFGTSFFTQLRKVFPEQS